ncbi:MAG: putative RNA uridine N3 methyltransferase [Nitrososphaerota archaeon]
MEGLSSGSSSTFNVRAPPAAVPEIHVLIPSTYAEDAAHLREKTMRIGFLFRAMTIFRVSQMIIYEEDPEKPSENSELIKLLCEYLSTPPYLRKKLFRLRPELRYAGLLPPLNIPTHPPSPIPPSDTWELREGLLERRGELTLLHAGLRRPIVLEARRGHGGRVLLLVRSQGKKIKFRIRRPKELPYYLGTKVLTHKGTLREIVKRYRYSIATDREGEPVIDAWDRISTALKTVKGPVCVAFGSYRRGLGEIAELQNSRLEEVFDICVNFIPYQGVRSVRTEEAVYSVLALLNIISLWKG